ARLARVPLTVAAVVLRSDVPRNIKYTITLRHLVDVVTVNSLALVDAWRERGIEPQLMYIGVSGQTVVRGREAMRAELGLRADDVVIGTLARLANQKRLDRLLQAVQNLPEHVHCVIAGDGPDRSSLAELTRAL